MTSTRCALAAALAASFASGCRDTSSFTTAPGEAYCGSVVQGSFVRAGFAPDVALRLTFDADKVTTSPGVVATSDGLLADAPVRAMPQLFHDPLSTLDFGEGRRKSYLYAADPASGAQLTIVVSLMESDDVEVRVLRVGRDGSTDPADRPIFGVFPLTRRKGACF